MAPGDAFLIVNPTAGGGPEEGRCEELVALLAAEGLRARPHVTRAAGEAREAAERALREGAVLVVAAGGDGTIAEVLEPLAGSGVALGVIPLGTANVAARELGLPRHDLAAACRIVAAGHAAEVDLGLCEGQPFLVNCGVGLDALVAQQVDRLWKRHLGKWAFVGQFLQTLFQEPKRRFRVTVDARSFEAEMWAALVCNGAQYTWRLCFAHGARLDDGLLHVVMLHHPDALQLLGSVSMKWLAEGEEVEIPYTTVAAGREIRIDAEPPTPWQTDGEPRGVTPVSITLRPRALRVIVPAEPS